MAETQSPNYKWIKPDIGGDASTWGNVLNTTIDAVDSVVYANQQAGVQIGVVVMFAGATAPTNWLICDGSSLSTTGTYAALFAVLGYAYGGSGANFNLPNLVQHFPLGAGTNPVGTAGGAFAVTLSTSNMPSHTHGVNDPTHAHNYYDPTHIHGVSDPTHAHNASQDAHNHGGVMVPANGYFSLAAQNPQITSGRTDTQQPPVHIAASGTNVAIQAAVTGIQIYGNTTGISIQNAGSGAAFNVVPPFVAMNFIIRFA